MNLENVIHSSHLPVSQQTNALTVSAVSKLTSNCSRVLMLSLIASPLTVEIAKKIKRTLSGDILDDSGDPALKY